LNCCSISKFKYGFPSKLILERRVISGKLINGNARATLEYIPKYGKSPVDNFFKLNKEIDRLTKENNELNVELFDSTNNFREHLRNKNNKIENLKEECDNHWKRILDRNNLIKSCGKLIDKNRYLDDNFSLFDEINKLLGNTEQLTQDNEELNILLNNANESITNEVKIFNTFVKTISRADIVISLLQEELQAKDERINYLEDKINHSIDSMADLLNKNEKLKNKCNCKNNRFNTLGYRIDPRIVRAFVIFRKTGIPIDEDNELYRDL